MKILTAPFLIMAAAIGFIIFLVMKGLRTVHPSTGSQRTMPNGGASATTPVQTQLNKIMASPTNPVAQTQGSTGDFFTNTILPNAPKILQTVGDVLGLNSPSPTQGDTSGITGAYDPSSTYSTDPGYTFDAFNAGQDPTAGLDLNSLSNDFSGFDSLSLNNP